MEIFFLKGKNIYEVSSFEKCLFLKNEHIKILRILFLEFEKCKIYLNTITLYKLIRNRGPYILIYYYPQEVGEYSAHTSDSPPAPSGTEHRQIKNLEHKFNGLCYRSKVNTGARLMAFPLGTKYWPDLNSQIEKQETS